MIRKHVTLVFEDGRIYIFPNVGELHVTKDYVAFYYRNWLSATNYEVFVNVKSVLVRETR